MAPVAKQGVAWHGIAGNLRAGPYESSSMLPPDTIFSAAGALALLCWLALALSLVIAPVRVWTWRTTSLFVPATLAVAYVLLIHRGFGESPGGGFGSVTEVRRLFASDAALVAGWLHYLAIDLFVGTWIVRTGIEERIHPLFLLSCLPFTFLAGPAGLVIFPCIRLVALPRSPREARS